jgi:hypothetical protein
MPKTIIHITSAKQFFIKWDDSRVNEIIIPTPQGDLVLAIDRIPALTMAAELAAAETQRTTKELKQMTKEMRQAYPLNVLESIQAFPGRGGLGDEPKLNL